MLTADLLTRLCDARRSLQGELDSALTVSALAREAGLTTAHFITQFRSVFGQTPLQVRARMRLEVASHQLATTQRPISDIALDVGFDNMGSFSRAFRQQFGCSAREYRKRASTPCVPPAGCVDLLNAAWAGIEISAKSARRGGGIIAPNQEQASCGSS